MSAEADPLDLLGNAARRILRLRAELAEAVEQKNAALVMLHEDGVPKCHVADRAVTFLVEHGFRQEDIAALALSPGSVRLVLDASRRPPVPVPSSCGRHPHP